MSIAIFVILLVFIGASAWSPPEKLFLSKRWFRITLTVVAAFPIMYAFFKDCTPGVFTFDDSYISLSAARNLAEHFELAVVRGHPLQGITSPLHVILVGFLGMGVGVEMAARLVSLVSFFFIVVGCGKYAERFTQDRRSFFLAAGLCLFSGPLLYDIGNGMETSLFTALAIWTFYIAQFAGWSRRGIVARGVVAGCAMLTRPEGLIVATAAFGIPAIAALFKRDWNRLGVIFIAGAIAGLVYVPFLAANLIYTGHVLSATVSAKWIFFRQGELQTPSLADLRHPLYLLFLSAEFVGVAALLGLLIAGRFAELVFVTAFYLAYLIRFPDALNHYRVRYQHPLWTIVALGATLLVFFISRRVEKIKIVRILVPAVLAAVVIFPTAQAAMLFRSAFNTDTKMVKEVLLPMVMNIASRTQEHDLVAAHDVGALIYYSHRNVLDLVGLTDEKIARRLAVKRPVPDSIKELVRIKRPKVLVVLHDWETDHMHLTEGAPPGRFHLVWTSPVNMGTGAFYDVYECRW